jgi:hypothetical protein
MITKYNISISNIYNFNKKGFLIDLLKSTKRIIFINILRNKRIARASQNSSREFITLITSIYADSLHLTPTLIY